MVIFVDMHDVKYFSRIDASNDLADYFLNSWKLLTFDTLFGHFRFTLLS